jgi:16S rRNA (adenine1518-N6/adenine1519-N6)-dimethyltransferase
MDKIKAKKSLGQNFLINKHFQEKICEFTHELKKEYPDLNMLEIGPGRGDLTKYYFKIAKDTGCKGFDLYEIDIDLIEGLESLKIELNSDNSKILDTQIYNVDFMKVIPTLKPTFLVSNLPYYIGSRLIIDLIKYNKNFPFAFILQKEVAYKTSKTEKSKPSQITLFGAILNLFYDTSLPLIIPPSAFVPAPKVHSALLIGRPKTEKDKVPKDGEKALKILKAMFFKPNKTLLNNLVYGFGISSIEANSMITLAGLDGSVRMNWENYERVFWGLYGVS